MATRVFADDELARLRGFPEINSCSYLRQFIPDVLKAIEFTGGTGSEALMEAVAILKKLNADGARKVPDHAPTDFVPAKWVGYQEQAAQDRDVTAYRHFWELTVLLGLGRAAQRGCVCAVFAPVR